MADAILTGPVVLPGDAEPIADCPVKIRMVAGNPRTPGHTNGSAVLGEWQTETDATGDFTVTVPVVDNDLYPTGAYYEVTVGGGRFPKYVRKVQPTVAGTYVFTDPSIYGEDVLPPEFAQADYDPAVIALAVEDYFTANPIEVDEEVEDYFELNPPLLVANNLSDVTDDAAARLAIGAASDSDTAAALAAALDRIAALELFISSTVFVTAEGVSSVVLSFPGGVPTFETT